MKRYQYGIALALVAGLCACTGVRSTAPVDASASVPPSSVAEPPPPPPPQPEPPPSESAGTKPPPRVVAAIQNCVPPDAQPKPKARAKPPSKQAPLQPNPASGDTGNSSDRALEAQVRAIVEPVMSILGKPVHDPRGDDLGRVVDVLADSSGRVRIAVIDFGGFLGVGDRRIAVDWPLLHFSPGEGNQSLVLSVSRERLKTVPEYKQSSNPQALMMPRFADSAHSGEMAAPADNKK